MSLYRNLDYRAPRIQNLGAAIGLVVAAARRVCEHEAAIAEDLAAFHAPSECADLAYRGIDKPISEAMDKVWELTGHPWWMVVQEAKVRTGGRYLGLLFHELNIPEARDFEAEA